MTQKDNKVYVLHENYSWVEPLFHALKELEVPFHDWFINDGQLDLTQTPPNGIFYNRMSASSHTRGHRYSIELAESVLTWLETHGRKVVNDRRALNLEVRKSEQQLVLNRFDLKTPKTILVNNLNHLTEAAKGLGSTPFIIKPNRGGKGVGVKLYKSLEHLMSDVKNDQIPESLDGILLVQEYLKPVDGRITRLEFIGGELYYAVRIDSSNGFELCPADSCNINDAFCPVGQEHKQNGSSHKFRIVDNYENSELFRYRQFLQASGIQIGALEYITDSTGNDIIYDVNTNTNYNSEAEIRSGKNYRGMYRIAEFLKQELTNMD
ncbi:MAG: alpha-L-glutamate ligase [Bacteroidia bacterium]|nr:alpha-L-glutamate ligase [Bacteroidia bacterium]